MKHQYLLLGKADKGTMTRYLMKVTSYSLAQTKRLIRQYARTGSVKVKLARGNSQWGQTRLISARNGHRSIESDPIDLLASEAAAAGVAINPAMLKAETINAAAAPAPTNAYPVARP